MLLNDRLSGNMNMFKKNKIKKFIKQHPEIFNVNDEISYHSISDAEIPDIEWFNEKNKELLGRRFSKIAQIEESRKRWYLRKKYIIPVSFILILSIFLGATSVGRAMTENVYNTVVQFFTGEVIVKHGDSDAPTDEIVADKTVFRSIEEVKNKYSISVASSAVGTLDTIEAKKTDFQMILHITYAISNNSTIIITQTVSDTETEASVSIDVNEGQAVNVKTLDGIDVIGYVNNGIGYAIAFKDNITLDIYSDNIDFDQFTGFIRNMQFI